MLPVPWNSCKDALDKVSFAIRWSNKSAGSHKLLAHMFVDAKSGVVRVVVESSYV